MASKALSEREQAALFGLVTNPLLNDRELSEKIDFKQSTLTAIKNRLKRRGYMTPKRIPHFAKLGCELLTISYGHLNPLINVERIKKIQEHLPGDSNHQFFALAESSNALIFTVAKRFTDAKRAVEKIEHRFHSEDLISKGHR